MFSTSSLTPAQRDAVMDLLQVTATHDGVEPVDEAGRLALDGGEAQHLLLASGVGDAPSPATAADPELPLIGYVGLLADGTVQGAVHPAHRRRVHGRRLLEATLARRPDAGVWAHGGLEGSLAFLRAAGLEETRRLLQLRRDLRASPAAPAPAPRRDGVVLESFRRQRDAEDWLAVNAAAFAGHPEQGSLTRADFDRRRAEPWFDPEDLLLARAGEELLGFVWIKREHSGSPEPTAAGERDGEHRRDGEIYVVATAPSAQGQGIAAFLLGSALRRLQELGDEGATLFVEGDNTPALRLYEGWGFEVSTAHVQLRAKEG